MNSNTNSHKFSFTQEDLSRDLDNFIRLQGEPLGANSSYYIDYVIHKKAKDEGIKVLLSGQGGDEITGGYRGYPVQKILSMFENKEFIKAFYFLQKWSKNPQYTSMDTLKILLYSLSEFFLGNDIKNIFYKLNSNSFLKDSYLKNHINKKLHLIKFSEVKNYKGRRLIQRKLLRKSAPRGKGKIIIFKSF